MTVIPPRPGRSTAEVPPITAIKVPVVNAAEPTMSSRDTLFSYAPGYQWLNFLGSIHMFIGFAILIVSLCVALLLAIAPFMGGPKSEKVVFAALMSAAICAGAGVFIGGLYLAIGQILHAFRDIARNSWKTVDLLRR